METQRSARWIFIYNNPQDNWEPPKQPKEVAYMIWQVEKSTKGTKHIQGYIRFNSKKRFNTAKNFFAVPEIHIELAKGNEEQNRNYCSKSETRIDGPWEFGEFKKEAGRQGNRSDIHKVAEKILNGVPLKEVSEENPDIYIKYHNGIEKLYDLHRELPPMERDVKVYILWGPSGTGKTHRARTTFPDAYEVVPGRDPWEMYTDQETIIFDEFDTDRWTIQEMNRFLDKWRCSLDARYKNKHAYWKRVIICANSNPDNWWPHASPALRSSFERRTPERIHVESIEQKIILQ